MTITKMETAFMCLLCLMITPVVDSQSAAGDAPMSPGGSVGGTGGGGAGGFGSYFSDWGSLSGRPAQPTCVDIPKNMSLCHNIGYHKMRLPNLLDHDTMAEVSQQSASWVPLLNIKCHHDTQLFLCSLFSPVCLDKHIYPCRSLCEKVKMGCERRMKTYGFPWPDMLRCDKFPMDNDMCITAQSADAESQGNGGACTACNQVDTYENILDNFCRSEFAVKTKIRKIKKSRIICKKSKVLKAGGGMDKKDMRSIRRPKFVLDNMDECCSDVSKHIKSHFLIMGNKDGENLVPTFIMEWSRDSIPFKKAIKRFKNLNCSDPKMVSESMVADGAIKMDSPFAMADLDKAHRISNHKASSSLDSKTNRRTRKTRVRLPSTAPLRPSNVTSIEPADSS